MTNRTEHDGIGARRECERRPQCGYPIYCHCLEIEAETMARKALGEKQEDGR